MKKGTSFKKRFSFIMNETMLALYMFEHAAQGTRNTFSLRAKYIDPSAYSDWKYQNLEKNGYIIKTGHKQGRHFWKLTTEGMNLIELLHFKFGKKSKWDKYWRVLVFDIPEAKRGARDFLRRKLRELEFCRLQQSVWVTPYPIPKSFGWFLNKYALGKHVRYLVVNEINEDSDLKKFFNIK